MTLRPGVTVVVPTHRRPALMRRAVASVLAQEYDGDVEVIVVFDGCEPVDPGAVVRPSRSVRAMANSRSRGLAGARNTGIVAASHDHVGFLDDDDHWLPGKLEAQMAVFEEHPEAVLVGTAIVADDGRRTHERLVPMETVGYSDLLRDRLAGLHSSTFLFSRTALLGPVGLVDEHLPGSYGEDWDLLLRTARAGPIHVVNRPLVSVSWTGNSYFLGRWAPYAEGLEYLLEQHPRFREDRKAFGGVAGKLAFATAAAGRRRAALAWAGRSLRHDPTEPRAWLALVVALRLLSADRVVRLVQRMGRGI